VLPAPAASWMAPVRAPVSSGFRTRQRPNHNGVDLAAPRGTVVHAAAAGTVEVARCDPATGFCDRDGGMDTAGCGWYVDILHADGLLTRYCHLLRRPTVAVGQRVSAGQPIGLVGASGNADGAHVHFEVHVPGVGGDGAVDPVPFFAKRGVRLGGA